MNNGSVIIGVIKAIDPVSHVEVEVAGIPTRLEMKDVKSIEEVASDIKGVSSTIRSEEGGMAEPEYPESFLLSIGPYRIEMVLVRGDTFMMGYDGRGSLKCNSEPVHEVCLSSYYVNKEPIKKHLAQYLLDINPIQDSDKPFTPRTWDEANTVAERIADESGVPVSLITEAQWEYEFVKKRTKVISIEKYETDYCLDYYSDYRHSNTVVVNPVVRHNMDDTSHVCRMVYGPHYRGKRMSLGDKARIRISVLATMAFKNTKE